MSQISDERMREFIRQAKQAATIEDNTSGGMGLGPRAPRFERVIIYLTKQNQARIVDFVRKTS